MCSRLVLVVVVLFAALALGSCRKSPGHRTLHSQLRSTAGVVEIREPDDSLTYVHAAPGDVLGLGRTGAVWFWGHELRPRYTWARRGRRILLNSRLYGLDLTGWTLRGAKEISDDGSVIVGTGRNPNGDSEAWLAVIPEPATLILLLMGGLVLTKRRRQR